MKSRSWSAAAVVLMAATSLYAAPPTGKAAPLPPTAKPAAGAPVKFLPQVIRPAHFDVSPPLRDMKPILPTASQVRPPRERVNHIIPKFNKGSAGHDTTVQRAQGSANMPAPILSIEGLSNVDNATVIGGQLTPPDTQGDVGPNHYVQWVNLIFAIYDKSGNKIYPPQPGPPGAAGNTLWQGFGGPCETNNDGDPITLYDQLADRWLMAQFALNSTPFRECVAVSQTGDPTGAWNRYEYATTNNDMPDYPKFGVWGNAYYMTANQFLNGASWAGAGVFAWDRAAMIAGDPTAAVIYFDLFGVNPGFGGMLPAKVDGAAPPDGADGIFAEWDDSAWMGDPTDTMRIWLFHPDFVTPANSTFGNAGEPNQLIPTADLTAALCGGSRSCIPQPSPGEAVDSISDRLMYRLQYRNFGGYQTLVTNFTVDADAPNNHAGVHWFELRNPGSGWVMNQEGTYAPDSDHRWMGSAAMDASGNIAVGYSVSSSTTFPSVRYAGRLAGDPAGVLSQGEAELVAGSGVISTGYNRWGDYSMMAVDPVDGCTFWYTQMYVQAHTPEGGWDWNTRFGSFIMPGCGSATGTLTGHVTDGVNPIAGATVAAGGFTTTTDATGLYTMYLPAATYDVTASKFGYIPETFTGIVITAGETMTQDFALALAPSFHISGTVRDGGAHVWPLYARIDIKLGPTPIMTLYSNPLTGNYDTGPLPDTFTYDFTVTAVFAGYQVATGSEMIDGSDEVVDWNLTPLPTCTAPGYSLATGTSLFTENFDSVGAPGLPANWAWQDVGGTGDTLWATSTGTVHPSGYAPHSAPNLAYFNSFSSFSGTARLYQTAGTDLSAAGTVTLNLWMFHDTGYSGSADEVQVEVSTDGGTTWQDVGAPIVRYDGSTGWKQHSVPLVFTGPLTDVRLGLLGISAFGDDVHIDDVQLVSTSCTLVPGGIVMGFSTDSITSLPLNGVTIAADSGETTQTVPTPNDPAIADGFYQFFVSEPNVLALHTLTASMAMYGTQQKQADVTANGVIEVDWALGSGHFDVNPKSLSARLYIGQTSDQALTLDNTGTATATVHLVGMPRTYWVPNMPRDRVVAVTPLESREGRVAPPIKIPNRPSPKPLAAGDIIQSWSTGLGFGWGLAFDKQQQKVWVGSPGAAWGGTNTMYEFSTSGTATGRSWPFTFSTSGNGPADLAYDSMHGTTWAMNISPNCIYELNPASGYTGNSICPGGTGFPISERGLAYDPVSDTFFGGGWNTLSITRFDRAGTILQTKNVGLAIAGLAYNPITGHLFVIESSATSDVWVLDVNNDYSVVGSFTIAGYGTGGAGLEFDCQGHLWAANQADQKVYEIDSGEAGGGMGCGGVNLIPWLTINPLDATVDAGTQTDIATQFVANNAPFFGLFRADISFFTDTPYSIDPVPVCLTKAFNDMAPGAFADDFVHALAGARISSGCGNSDFCPGVDMTRGVMARWVVRAMKGPDWAVPGCTGIFEDVICESTPNADYIEALFHLGVTAGCGTDPVTGMPLYCPDANITRAQMAVFLLRANLGTSYVPPTCTGIFTDVPCPSGFAVNWVEDLFNRNITAGCGSGLFCPNDPTARDQMSVFTDVTWNIPRCPAVMAQPRSARNRK